MFIEFLKSTYPQVVSYIEQGHTMYQTRKKFAKIIPQIRVDLLAWSRENHISLEAVL